MFVRRGRGSQAAHEAGARPSRLQARQRARRHRRSRRASLDFGLARAHARARTSSSTHRARRRGARRRHDERARRCGRRHARVHGTRAARGRGVGPRAISSRSASRSTRRCRTATVRGRHGRGAGARGDGRPYPASTRRCAAIGRRGDQRGLSVDSAHRHPSMAALARVLRKRARSPQSPIMCGIAFVLASSGTAAGARLGATTDPCEGVDGKLSAQWSDERRDEMRGRADDDVVGPT